MNNSPQIDFSVDKENNTISVKREFLAPRRLVWNCYTKAELLDQWFAPEPLTTKTRTMDFREGGHWHYAMVEPGGKEYWSRVDYLAINPIDNYKALDGFADESGEINADLPRSSMVVSFTDVGDNSLVHTIVTYDSLSDLETVIEMGIEEGITSTLNRLDELLDALTTVPNSPAS